MITNGIHYASLLVNSADQFFKNCPINIPCHAYAVGIPLDYEIGELLGIDPINSHSSDWDLLSVFKEELRITLKLSVEEFNYSAMKDLLAEEKHIIQITRMNTPCRDYHFYRYHSDTSISHKYRYFTPERVNCISYMREEYSLGFYVIGKAPAIKLELFLISLFLP